MTARPSSQVAHFGLTMKIGSILKLLYIIGAD